MRTIGFLGSVLVAALLAEGCTSSGLGLDPKASASATQDPNGLPATQDPNGPSASRDPHSPYKTTRAEYFLAVKACLQDLGYAVEIDIADGAIYTNEATDDLTRAAAAATLECEKGIDPKRLEPPPRPGPDELHAWYIYVVAQVRCYRDAGYPAPDPPPEQVFIDQGGYWEPAGKTVELTGKAVSPADARRCQQIPEKPAFFDW